MTAIRNGNKPLSLGELIFMREFSADNILAYKRILDGEGLTIVANIKGKPKEFKFNDKGTMTDLITGNKIDCSKKILLNGYQVMILK